MIKSDALAQHAILAYLHQFSLPLLELKCDYDGLPSLLAAVSSRAHHHRHRLPAPRRHPRYEYDNEHSRPTGSARYQRCRPSDECYGIDPSVDHRYVVHYGKLHLNVGLDQSKAASSSTERTTAEGKQPTAPDGASSSRGSGPNHTGSTTSIIPAKGSSSTSAIPTTEERMLSFRRKLVYPTFSEAQPLVRRDLFWDPRCDGLFLRLHAGLSRHHLRTKVGRTRRAARTRQDSRLGDA